MSTSKQLGVAILTMIVGLCAFELGERIAIPGVQSFVSTADAKVGRPLTPVSVAGVARRTSRRR